MPGIHAHYLRYLCVADNRKARRVLGFAPRRTTLDVILEAARARRGGSGLLDFDKLDEIARVADFHYEFRVKPPGRTAQPESAPAPAPVRPTRRPRRAAADEHLSKVAS